MEDLKVEKLLEELQEKVRKGVHVASVVLLPAVSVFAKKPDQPLENIFAMFNAAAKYGKYPVTA